jgi:hypothetical protein
MLARPDNRLREWHSRTDKLDALVTDIFQTILLRTPLPTELAAAKKLLAATNQRASLEDLVWSLINSDEFLLRH